MDYTNRKKLNNIISEAIDELFQEQNNKYVNNLIGLMPQKIITLQHDMFTVNELILQGKLNVAKQIIMFLVINMKSIPVIKKDGVKVVKEGIVHEINEESFNKLISNIMDNIKKLKLDAEHGRRFSGHQISKKNLLLYEKIMSKNEELKSKYGRDNFKQATRSVIREEISEYIHPQELNQEVETHYKKFQAFKKRHNIQNLHDYRIFLSTYRK